MTQINIETWQGILGIAVILIGGGAAWGTLKTDVSHIKKVLDEDIKPALSNLKERFIVAENKVEVLWGERANKRIT